jgi:hypothetical protein
MLYIGYFRFEFDDADSGNSEGRFSFAVEADDIDAACATMASTIMEKHGELLGNAAQLFLDDVVEIKSLPAGGVILRAEHGPHHADDPVYSVALPNYDGEECLNYRQGPDAHDDPEGAAEYAPQPFIEFEDSDDSEEE